MKKKWGGVFALSLLLSISPFSLDSVPGGPRHFICINGQKYLSWNVQGSGLERPAISRTLGPCCLASPSYFTTGSCVYNCIDGAIMHCEGITQDYLYSKPRPGMTSNILTHKSPKAFLTVSNYNEVTIPANEIKIFKTVKSYKKMIVSSHYSKEEKRWKSVTLTPTMFRCFKTNKKRSCCSKPDGSWTEGECSTCTEDKPCGTYPDCAAKTNCPCGDTACPGQCPAKVPCPGGGEACSLAECPGKTSYPGFNIGNLILGNLPKTANQSLPPNTNVPLNQAGAVVQGALRVYVESFDDFKVCDKKGQCYKVCYSDGTNCRHLKKPYPKSEL